MCLGDGSLQTSSQLLLLLPTKTPFHVFYQVLQSFILAFFLAIISSTAFSCFRISSRLDIVAFLAVIGSRLLLAPPDPALCAILAGGCSLCLKGDGGLFLSDLSDVTLGFTAAVRTGATIAEGVDFLAGCSSGLTAGLLSVNNVNYVKNYVN